MSTERRRKTDITGAGRSTSRAKRMPASSSTEAGARGTRCLQALVVTVDQASDTAQWYTVAKQLQLVSLELCEACRAAHTFHLRVDDDTPTTLLATVDDPYPTDEEGLSSRVPRLRARRVTWELPSLYLLGSQIEAFADMEELYFDSGFNGSLAVRAWPSRLRIIDMDDVSLFNQPIERVAWPTSLEYLWCGGSFNQPIEGVAWPNSLYQLEFGDEFNQPIEAVQWPEKLRVLNLRGEFNQPIEGVTWPKSLLELELGDGFNQPIANVAWPPSLEELDIGYGFDQPIQGVVWPTSLLRLTFDSTPHESGGGGNFNQPTEGVAWPPLLQHLTFGYSFNQPIGGVAWPQSLQDLTFGSDFNQPIEGVKWPTSLVRIELRGAFNHPIEGVKWPASLRQIELGGAFNKPIEGVKWPPSLQKLGFGQDFNQPVERVTWPTSLRQLAFGRDFNQPIGGDKWPTSLEELELGENFDQSIHGTKWPSLRRLRLTGAFRHSLQCLGSAMPALERFALYFRDDKARYSLLRGIEWPALLTHLEVCADAKLDGVSIPSHVSLVSS
ncbi:unnamed protein product [Scytosiphon promiscuus]